MTGREMHHLETGNEWGSKGKSSANCQVTVWRCTATYNAYNPTVRSPTVQPPHSYVTAAYSVVVITNPVPYCTVCSISLNKYSLRMM